MKLLTKNIAYIISKFLDIISICRWSITNKHCNQILQNQEIWKYKLFTDVWLRYDIVTQQFLDQKNFYQHFSKYLNKMIEHVVDSNTKDIYKKYYTGDLVVYDNDNNDLLCDETNIPIVKCIRGLDRHKYITYIQLLPSFTPVNDITNLKTGIGISSEDGYVSTIYRANRANIDQDKLFFFTDSRDYRTNGHSFSNNHPFVSNRWKELLDYMGDKKMIVDGDLDLHLDEDDDEYELLFDFDYIIAYKLEIAKYSELFDEIQGNYPFIFFLEQLQNNRFTDHDLDFSSIKQQFLSYSESRLENRCRYKLLIDNDH